LIMKQQSIQNVMADHRILDARIHGVESDAHFDTLHVAIRAEARDVEVASSLSFDKAVAAAKKRSLETYVEIWSFLRKPGAQTVSEGGLLEGRCPNCGADLEEGQAVKCDHCGALVNSGRYDWVLAEITQAEEWRPGSVGAVRGLAGLQALDPEFNRQAAEDRASYLFWRWIEALVTGSASPLAKVASQEFKAHMEADTQAGPGRYFKVAVGGVDLVGCETGVGARDRCHVKVLWSSARSQKGQPVHHVNVISMGRNAGVTTAEGADFSHAHCPECLGPLNENDSPTCDYCGACLDAGEKEWILEAVIQPEELRYAASVERENDSKDTPFAVVPDMGDRRERTLLLMRMAAVVIADGVVTKDEMKLLKRAAKRWQVPFEAVAPILDGEFDLDVTTTLKPANPNGFFAGLVSAALIDGRIDKRERRLLLDVSRNLSIPDRNAEQMMQEMSAARVGGG
jgi:tellurite resistance protein